MISAIKILFFIETLNSGGKERRLVELLKGLTAYQGFQIELAITNKDIHYKDVLNLSIPIHVLVRNNKKDPGLFFKFYKIAKRFNPDIIHVWGQMTAIYAIPTKVLLGIPMINNQIANAPLKVPGGLLNHKLSFLFSDKIVANTYAGLKSYNAPKKKSSVIYNGLDFQRTNRLEDKESIRQRYHIAKEHVVGMVAAFQKRKDYTTYIKMAINVLKTRNDISFICVGGGDDTKYRNLVEEIHKDRILFLGKQQNVENIMNVCDIGVLISNVDEHGEGISNALLEFSSLGKPIIAVDNGGNPELINDGENGFLIPPRDIGKLQEKIIVLLDNSDYRKQLGHNAKTIVERRFGIKRMIDEFVALYQNVSNGNL